MVGFTVLVSIIMLKQGFQVRIVFYSCCLDLFSKILIRSHFLKLKALKMHENTRHLKDGCTSASAAQQLPVSLLTISFCFCHFASYIHLGDQSGHGKDWNEAVN